MSLTRHKIAFRNAFGERDDFDAMWNTFARALIDEAGGESLRVPSRMPDPEALKRQGDLFAELAASGLSRRRIAKITKSSKSTVHRSLSLACDFLGTAA